MNPEHSINICRQCHFSFNWNQNFWIKLYHFTFLFIVAVFIFQNAEAGVSSVAVSQNGMPFALDDDGTVWGFRAGGYNQFENPYKITGLYDVVSISPYAAVKKDGHVLTWQLVEPQPERHCQEWCDDMPLMGIFTTPEIVEGVEGAVKVVGGFTRFEHRVPSYVYMALLSNGRVILWKQGLSVKNTGNNDKKLKYMPVKTNLHILSWSKSVTDITIAEWGGATLNENGEIYAWGLNRYGQLGGAGLGERVPEESPIRLIADKNVAKIFSTTTHLIALTKDGRAIYWGGCPGTSGNIEVGSISVAEEDGVNNIVDIGNMYRSDGSEIYVLQDGGSLYTVPPKGCSEIPLEGRRHSRSIMLQGMDKPAIASGDGVVVGSDHSLWRQSGGVGHLAKVEIPPQVEIAK